MGDIDLGIFQKNLEQLIVSSTIKLSKERERQLRSLKEQIKYMGGFLEVTEKKRYGHLKVMNLVRHIKDLVSEAEDIVDLFVVQAVKACCADEDHPPLHLESVMNKIETLTAEIKQIYDKNIYDINGVVSKKSKHSVSKSEGGSSSVGGSNTSKGAEEMVVVGFKLEVDILMGKLHNCGEGGQLEIISIVGAAGGGKTTLAREVYEHRLTRETFIRAWVIVPQDYNNTLKRNLLIPILESTSQQKCQDYKESSDDKLGEDVYKCLKGKKYLIVMDDIWGIEAWNDIQRSLPKKCNGSKVLFTSRIPVEPNSIPCIPHRLDRLSKSYSWELLQNKVFGKKCCPPELVGIGEHIAEKCEGLPLAIVSIAGILAVKDKTLSVWKKVSKHVSSIIAESQDRCMEILEFSYNHLPLHLKACFVYIGGFLEDSEILMREMIWLWIAEGFVRQTEDDKNMEDIAKDYLSSLIDRSLVMVARKSCFGEMKACRIHGLLRELCMKKAEEDDFFLGIYRHGTFSPSTKHRRLFIGHRFFSKFPLRPCPQNLRSFLCLGSPNLLQFSTREKDLSFFVENFELLRVLSFISTKYRGKLGKGHLVHLRYLALQVPFYHTYPFESLFPYLFNLETVNLQGPWHSTPPQILPWLQGIPVHPPSWLQTNPWLQTIPLPRDIFKMVKLRHLYAKRVVFDYHLAFLYPDIGIGCDSSSKLDSLQTLYPICPCERCQNFLARTPNLRKLGFYGDLIANDFVLMLPDLDFLKCLETLRLEQFPYSDEACTLPRMLKFPPTITRLTLKFTCLKWEELSILQTMPSLEVLKLLRLACLGTIWDTSELEEFSQLKYLKLRELDIKEWIASDDQFPRLEVLVVQNCVHLGRIPSDFANLYELREITLGYSLRSTVKSARDIQKEQRNIVGDDGCINLVVPSSGYDYKTLDDDDDDDDDDL